MPVRLPSGHTVNVTALGGGAYDFETKNQAGETISTVRQAGETARQTMTAVLAADRMARLGGVR